MNTAASCSKPIRTIILNDFRRFWVLSLAEFLVLFLATTAAVIINYSNLQSIAMYIQSTMDMSNVFMTGPVYIFTMIAAIVVFRYMHLVNAAAVCHSLPVTRGQLYIGHLISGYVLTAAPVIVNNAILMILSKPVYYDENMYYSSATEAIRGRDMFTVKAVLVTMLLLLLIMLFVYVISVFAGMLCGTSVMHIIGAVGLNVLAPALLAFVCEYAQLFLYGFSTSSAMRHTIKLSTPILSISSMRTRAFPNSDSINILPVIIYILIAAVIVAAGYFLYRQRKLENAAEPLAFKIMVPVVCGLITFFAATVIGLFAGEESRFFIWFITGTVVFYVLSRMLTLKTTRVFNKGTLKALGIYAVIIAVFISIFAFDVSGYENRIPKDKDIESVSTDVLYQTDMISTRSSDGKTPVFTSRENIENIKALHREFLLQKSSAVISGRLDSFLDNSSQSCSYTLKNGHRINRSYNVSSEFIADSKALKALYESDEYKEIFSLYNNEICHDLSKASISLLSYTSEEHYSTEMNSKRFDTLIAAMEKDFKERTFEQELDSNNALGAVEISVSTSPDEYGNATGDYIRVPVLASDTNTIKWLKKYGYYTLINASDYIVESASLFNNSNGSSLDISRSLKGKTLEEICNLYPCTPVEADTYYELSLELKRKGSSNTYYYSMSYSKKTLPEDFRDLILK